MAISTLERGVLSPAMPILPWFKGQPLPLDPLGYTVPPHPVAPVVCYTTPLHVYLLLGGRK